MIPGRSETKKKKNKKKIKASWRLVPRLSVSAIIVSSKETREGRKCRETTRTRIIRYDAQRYVSRNGRARDDARVSFIRYSVVKGDPDK